MSIPEESPRGPVLAIAVFGDAASVALRHGDSPAELVVADETVGQAHSARILAQVPRELAESVWRPADLAGLALEAGPGDVPGLRVACAMAQGFGLALDIPVCPVGSLETAAVSFALARPPEGGDAADGIPVFVANDARMGEGYFGVYQARVDAARHIAVV